jgi:acyl-CoA thioesterase YciA
VGDLASFYGKVIATGTTSVTVEVHVYSQRWATVGAVVKVAQAVLTYVAVDAEGRKRSIAPRKEG